MQRSILFAIGLVPCLSLHAGNQEVDLVVIKPITQSYTWPGSSISAEVKPHSPTAFVLRYGHDVGGFGSAQIQLQASYHAQSRASIPGFATAPSYTVREYIQFDDLKNEGLSLGAEAQWRLGIEVGLGCELRYEKLQIGTVQTSQTRPWLSGRFGYSLPMRTMRVVFGLQTGIALTNQGDPSYIRYYGFPEMDTLMKRISPRGEAGLYCGIRF